MLNRRGFTVIEMVVVLIMIGVAAAIVIPRALKSSPNQQVNRAARQLTRDLELVRMRAIAAKRLVRLQVDENAKFYTAFMDTTDDRSGNISGTVTEMRQSGLVARGSNAGIPGADLPNNIEFGCGNSGPGPLSFNCSGDPVALDVSDRAEFDTRGMLTPLGTTGAVYLVHEQDPEAVAAVTLSGGGSFRYWRWVGGAWVK